MQNFRFLNLPITGLVIALCLISLNTEIIAKSNPEKKAKRLYKSGMVFNKKGNYEGALSKFEAAIEIYPEYVEATLEHGVAGYTLGNYKNAKDDFTRTIELDNDNELAYYFRGKTNKTLGKPKESLNDFSKAIELAPGNAHLYFERAIIKSDLSDYSGAMDDYNNAIYIYRKEIKTTSKKFHIENMGNHVLFRQIKNQYDRPIEMDGENWTVE